MVHSDRAKHTYLSATFTVALLLLYCCFTAGGGKSVGIEAAAWAWLLAALSDCPPGRPLLLLYCCLTTALLMLYYWHLALLSFCSPSYVFYTDSLSFCQ